MNIPELHFTKKDFEITYYKDSGPGGQHRNKTMSGVRIKHLETGIIVENCETRSQIQNKETAFKKIAQLLINHYRFNEETKKDEYRSDNVVRTYNAINNLVRDNRFKSIKIRYTDLESKDKICSLINTRNLKMKLVSKHNPHRD